MIIKIKVNDGILIVKDGILTTDDPSLKRYVDLYRTTVDFISSGIKETNGHPDLQLAESLANILGGTVSKEIEMEDIQQDGKVY